MTLEQLGKYKIIKTIGEGGFGVVYLAEDNIGLRVALKVLHSHIAADEMLAAYFKREAKALARLSHPHIVSIHGYDEIDNRSFIVMEFIEGTTLSELLAGGQQLPLPQVLSVFRQTLAALGHAHGKGVIHRDVKPANIMLAADGATKIADFGIARLADSEKLTRTGTGAGSLLYMSPEQIKGKDIDHRSDLYSLGVSLYQVLTSTTPFSGDSDYEIMSKQLNDPPPPLRQSRPDLPQSLEDLILKAMSKKKEDRFQSAAEMAEVLAGIQDEIGVEKVDPERTEVSARAPRLEETVIARPPASGFPLKLVGIVGGLVAAVIVVLLVVIDPFGESSVEPDKEPPSQEESLPQTFSDSLTLARQIFAAGDHAAVIELAEQLMGAESASADNVTELVKLTAAALVSLDSTAAADRLFADLYDRQPNATFADDRFGSRVGRQWRRYQESRRPVTPTEGKLYLSLSEDWVFFKPLTVRFDGKSVDYQGGEISLTAEVRNRPYEVMVLTDVSRFTDTVYLSAAERRLRFDLSRSRSTLTVSARNVDDPDDFVFAEVYIDGELAVDETSGTNCDTPCNRKLYNGSHKVEIRPDDELYRLIDGPKLLSIKEDQMVEFRVDTK
jgi:serine/threonine protein kinase